MLRPTTPKTAQKIVEPEISPQNQAPLGVQALALTKPPSLLLPVTDTIKQKTQQSGGIHKGFLHQLGEPPHPCIPKRTDTTASGAVVPCTAVRVPWVQ